MPKNINWSQMLGWAIFALVLAGGPLLNVFQSVTGIALPSFTLPALIAFLMLASAGASMWRSMRGNRSDSTYPTDLANTNDARPANQPMPSFGEGGASFPRFGPAPSRMPPPTAMPPTEMPQRPATPLTQAQLPQSSGVPKLEPVISPRMILLGITGGIVLVALAVLLFVAP